MAAPLFEILRAKDSLLIPLSTESTEIGSVQMLENQVVQAHASFLSGALENSHRPILPVTGTTNGLTKIQLASGGFVQAMKVSIGEIAAAMPPVETSDQLSKILAAAKREQLPRTTVRLQDAGLHADRIASPNLIRQLTQAVGRPIDTVLCSILDSDPSTPLQSIIAKTYPIELVAGLAFVQRIVGASRGAVAFSPQKLPTALRTRLKEHKLAEITLSGDYPQSDPSLLLYTVLGRKLRPGRLPTDLGAFILDSTAAVAIGRFVLLDEPMTMVPIAIHDWRERKTRYAIAPIGLQLCEALAQMQIQSASILTRGGDSLRDVRIGKDSVICGSELVFHLTDAEPAHNPDPCIRCGWCVEVCPTRVQPAGVLEAAQRNDADLADRMGVSACIECGLCSFVCPSKLPLLTAIRQAKEIKPQMNVDSRR